jgi:hypothetical protein
MPWAILENRIKRADNPAVDGGQEARDSDDGERFVPHTDRLGRRSGPRRKYTIAGKRSMVEETRAHGALSRCAMAPTATCYTCSADSQPATDLLPVKVTMPTVLPTRPGALATTVVKAAQLPDQALIQNAIL